MFAEKATRIPRIVFEINPEKRLTQKAIEVLQLRANGLSYPQIAQKLGTTEYAVGDHSAHTYVKLNVNSLTQAIVVVAKQQIIDVDSAIKGLDLNRVNALTARQQEIIEEVIKQEGSLEKAALALGINIGSLYIAAFKINKVVGLGKAQGDQSIESKNKFSRAVLLFMVAKERGILNKRLDLKVVR